MSLTYLFFFLSLSWLLGRRPEYTDPKVVAQGEGREGLFSICVCISLKNKTKQNKHDNNKMLGV